MIKGVIFDFDGVIADTEKKKFDDLMNILSINNEIVKFSFKDFIGKKRKHFIKENFPEMTDKDIENKYNQIQKEESKDLEKINLIKGINELLSFLRENNLLIAITTGSKKDFVDSILKINSINDYFDVIITGEDFKSSKPSSECYEITLKRINLKPDEVIAIEDSPVGISAAKAINLKVFALGTYLPRQELMQADKQFKNHEDLLAYLKSSLNNS